MKKNIAIIMGGYSSEYKISLQSGNVVYQTLDKAKYAAYRIHIFKEKWVYVDVNDVEYSIDKNDFSVTVNGNKITFDCVFNAIHGSPGEDGFMQGYFELLGVNHTSCDMYQAALTFNKRDCLSVLKPYGILTADSYYLNLGDTINEDEIIAKVGLPCFVKANKAGSSFGVTKVHEKEDLQNAIYVAFKEDDEIIIESFLDGTEVSVGVITYKGQTKVLPITEIVSENDFFDYEAKYLGKSQEITPARLTKEQEEKVNTVAKKVYEVLKMKGFSRSEFIFKNNEPHLLEMNTVPGLTNASILPQQAQAAGISMAELFSNAIEESLTENNLPNTDLLISKILDSIEKIGKNIQILDLRNIDDAVCDYFIITDIEDTKGVQKITSLISSFIKKELNENPWHIENNDKNWTLIDYNSVVVHVFTTKNREYYDINSIWTDNTYIEENSIWNGNKNITFTKLAAS